ncbi:MAG: hypothetical protein IKV50_09225 [Clostridia bacterium]|nr:hypothetical protein [Clostridia bacterium]MBR5264858.1 hypothetical protein [Clostridia bacterium]
MKICSECMAVFEDHEAVTWTEPYGQRFTGCPRCYGNFEEAYICHECGEYFPEDSLFNHVCESCLRESITYDVALEYLRDNENYLLLFMFGYVFDSSVPEYVGEPLKQYMVEQFNRERMEASYGGHEFLDSLKAFILDDDGDYGKERYAIWLENKSRAERKERSNA